jgi:hypothetical protein
MKNIMLVEAEIWTVARTDKGNAVLVKPVGSEQAVPIFIGQLEAQSILFGLASVPVPRPMTHDLFISVLEKTGVTVERIEITDLKDRTFYARIILKQGIKKLTVDSRPSDALGIASRLKCPVYIAEAIVDEAGVAVSLVSDDEIQLQVGEEEAPEPEIQEEDEEKSRLEQQLKKAVEEENYEEAARLRDRLKELQ